MPSKINNTDNLRSFKLIKNTGLFFVGSLGSKLLTYLLIPLYTKILTTEEYGICDTMFTTVSLLYPIFTLIISEAVFRYALDKDFDQGQTFTIGLLISGIGFLATMALSPLLLLSSKLAPYYWYFVAYYFVTIAQVLFSQFSKGINQVLHFTISGIIGTLITLVSTIVLLTIYGMGIRGYLLAYILGDSAICLYLILSCRLDKYVSKFEMIKLQHIKYMLKYSLPIIPNSASWWINTSSDKYIINILCGYTATGVYSISYKIPSLMTTITGVFLSAWQISAVDELNTNEASEFYSKVYQQFFAMLVVAVAILIPLSRPVARILFSNGFYEAWIYVPVLLFAYLFHNLSAYLGSVYTASKKTDMLFFSTLIGALINIIMNLMLIPKFGAFGAAVATLLSFFSVWLFRTINTAKILKITIRLKKSITCMVILMFEIILEMLNHQSTTLVCVILSIIILLINFRSFIILFKRVLKMAISKRGDRL